MPGLLLFAQIINCKGIDWDFYKLAAGMDRWALVEN